MGSIEDIIGLLATIVIKAIAEDDLIEGERETTPPLMLNKAKSIYYKIAKTKGGNQNGKYKNSRYLCAC